MDPKDVKLTIEEQITVVVTGILKGCAHSMMFWFMVWQGVVGYLWFPHMDAMLDGKPGRGDFYLNLVLAQLSAFGSLLATAFILMAANAIYETMYDHFKKHINEEAETLKKNLVKDGERKLLK